jgi:hypothetical protein
VPRVEDGRLLTGRGSFIDDHRPVAGLSHARILGYDVEAHWPWRGWSA